MLTSCIFFLDVILRSRLNAVDSIVPNESAGSSKCCNSPCLYTCSTKEKYVRGVKMAHVIACKKCCIAFYSMGSFHNHMDSKHPDVKMQLHHYLHICLTVIKQYFELIKEAANLVPVDFFRRWYFYDNCGDNRCEFGCDMKRPFACKVCRLKFDVDVEIVEHIVKEHDHVSVKPLLHVCPSMLGNPPVRPIHEAKKYKAITHHSFVPILNEVKKFATPIRPIKRKKRQISVAHTVTTFEDKSAENESVTQNDSLNVGVEQNESAIITQDTQLCQEAGFEGNGQAMLGLVKIKSEPVDSYQYDATSTLPFDNSNSLDPFLNIKCEKDTEIFDNIKKENEQTQHYSCHTDESFTFDVKKEKNELENYDDDDCFNLNIKEEHNEHIEQDFINIKDCFTLNIPEEQCNEKPYPL